MRRMASPPNASSLIAYAVGHDGAPTSVDGRTGSAVHFHHLPIVVSIWVSVAVSLFVDHSNPAK
jgi:hypothetical protein